MRAEFRLNHIALVVRDLAASAAFYGGTLGLREIENRTRRPTIRWFAFDGARELHLITGPDEVPPPRPLDSHLCLATPHFDATLADLAAAGLHYCGSRGEPMRFSLRADGVRQAYFQDPDGHWIEVCESDAQGRVG